MTSRHTGTIRGHGLSGKSYAGIRGNYALPGDVDRELAAQPSVRELADALHARIAALSPEHAALVADYERLRARAERQS